MADENDKVSAGTEVPAGTYRCNACANEHEVLSEGEILPPCDACYSISWRSFRPPSRPGKDKDRNP